MSKTVIAGKVTSYGAAVRGGYTGTYEQWCQDMANLGNAVAEVREEKTAAIAAVGAARSDAVEAVGQKSTEEQAAIDAEGQRVLATIPEDYTELIGDVDDLKSAKAPVIIDTASGAIAHFEDGADNMPLKSLTVNIEPVQSGSGDPSPTNVRPISGRTGCNVTRTGKNLLGEIEQGTISVSGADSSNIRCRTKWDSPIAAPAGTTFTITGNATNGAFNAYIGVYADAETTTRLANSGWLASGESYTIPSGGAFIRITFRVFDNSNVTPSNFANVQLELGSTATAYEPYQGATYPITFPSPDPGTVYGGTLDVTNGVLTVDRIFATLDGSEDWNMYSAGKYYVNNVGSYYFGAAAGKYISNLYPFSGNGSSTSASITEDKHFYGQKGSVAQNYRRIWVYDSSYSTLEDFKAALNLIPLQVVIPIDSPIVYDLSGIPESTTLLGTNNIWADCGPVSVDYPADTKLYIQKINAPTDDDMTADTQIASGKYFLIGNTLYLSTTTIPAGDTIIPGTNCQTTNLAAALNALNT